MAVIRDMIPPFELYQPAGVDDAVRLMDEYGDQGWVLAGGLDTFDWFKDRIKRPAAVIDLAAVDEIRGIAQGGDGGLDIGAMTSLTAVAEHADVQSRYPLLAEAAGLVATPQIRNQGTLGGTSRRIPVAGTTGAGGHATVREGTSATQAQGAQ